MVSLSKKPGAGARSMIGGGSDGVIKTGRFHTPTGDSPSTVTEGNMGFIMPFAATLKNFYVLLTVAPGGSDGWTFTIRDVGVDTALTVTISGSDLGGEDTTHEVSVLPGSWITLHTEVVGEPAQGEAMWGFEVA